MAQHGMVRGCVRANSAGAIKYSFLRAALADFINCCRRIRGCRAATASKERLAVAGSHHWPPNPDHRTAGAWAGALEAR